MKKLLLLSTMSLFSFIGLSQYCITGGPSSANDSQLASLSLIGTSGNITYTGCPGFIGVQEVLAQSTNLDAGSNYNLNLVFGTCGGNFSSVGEAWIDFNGDGSFSTTESIGTWSGTPTTGTTIFNFTVPFSAVNGSTRMRVIQQESTSLPINPCAAFTWGSVTDFSIVIENGVDCSTVLGDEIANPRMVATYPYTQSNNSSICFSNMNPVYDSPDVYYLLTDFSTIPSLEISLCGSSFDTYLTVILPDGTVVGNNDDHPDCGSQSKITIGTYNYDSLYVIVEGWGNNQGDYTLTINEGTLGLSNLDIDNSFIYPNPSNDFIQFNDDYQGEIEIINIKGDIVYNKNIQPLEKVSVHSLQKGIYFVRSISGNKRIVHKLIIQ